MREPALLGPGEPDVVELEALGPVDRAEHDRVGVGAAGFAVEREVGEQVAEGRPLGALLVGAREPDERAEVAQPPLGPRARRSARAAAGRPAQAVGLAGGDEDRDDLVAEPERAVRELVRGGQERAAEVAQRGRLAGREARDRRVGAVGQQRPLGMGVGMGEQGAAGPRPDTAPGRGRDAGERETVARVGRERQRGERVADAGPLGEGGRPDDDRAHAGAEQRLLDRRELRVHADEHGPRLAARGGAGPRGDPPGLLGAVGAAHDPHRRPVSPVVHRSAPRGGGRSRARRLAAARIAPVERWLRPRLTRWASGKSAARAPKFASLVALR